jgi:hypothetical protein
MQDRAALGAPGREEIRDARLELGIVAAAPTRIVESPLEVDDEEGGSGGDRGAHGSRLPEASPRTKTAIPRIGESDGMKGR